MTLLWGVFIFHGILSFALLYGLHRLRRTSNSTEEKKPGPFLSVIVPARNEEKNIGKLLKSLSGQDYPSGSFEVIVVDDRSTDATAKTASEAGKVFRNFCLLKIENSPHPLSGKQRALDAGIHAAHGPFVVFTDADCAPSPGFLTAYANVFSDGCDFAFGRTDIPSAGSFFQRLQAGDLIHLFAAAGGMAAFGLPLSAMGNNLGFIKEKYLDMGGYASLGASTVEDYQLLTAFRRQKMRIRFIEPEIPLVATQPLPTFRQFILQRRRWARGALYLNGPMNLLIASAFLSSLSFISCLILLSCCPTAIYPLLFKVMVDFIFFRSSCIFFGRRELSSIFPFWEIYSVFSPPVLLALVLFTKRDRW